MALPLLELSPKDIKPSGDKEVGTGCLLMTCLPPQCPHCQANVPYSVDAEIAMTVSIHIHLFPAPKAASLAVLHVRLIILVAGDMEQRVKFFKC